MSISKFFSTSALVRGEWSASRPCSFTPGKRTPLDRRLGAPQSRFGRCGESVVHPITSRYTDYALLITYLLAYYVFYIYSYICVCVCVCIIKRAFPRVLVNLYV
jgi:hypothetical protein